MLRSRTALLAFSMFAIGTDGYVVAGLLNDISDRTGVSVPAAGQLITVFAICYAVFSPIAASLLGRLDRRSVMIGSLLVFALGNVVVAASSHYPILVAGRVIAAAGAATFTPTAMMTVGMIAPAQKRGQYLAYVISGLTIATVVGVPIGTFVGARLGYAPVFWAIAAVGVVAATALATAFKQVPAPPVTTLAQRLGAVRMPGAASTLAVTFIVFISAFTVYSYISEYFIDRADLGSGQIGWVLLTFGIGGAVGNVVGGRATDAWGVGPTMIVSLAGLATSFLLIALCAKTLALACILAFLWGVCGWLLAPAQQHRLMSIAGPAAPLLISLNSSGMYLGIGVSGLLGGIVIGSLGVSALPWVGVIAALVALGVVLVTYPVRRAEPVSVPA